jgi:uncharacterized membrane protein YphA (DoxX/SURF4 family)
MDATTENQTMHNIRGILRFTYGFVPIVAGLDKFTHLLTDWDKYLAPAVARLLPFNPHTFMLMVGVIEVVAGVIVLVRPKIGGYIVMAWLIGIAINLLVGGQYLDVAVRDLVMAVGAYALAKVAEATTVYDTAHTNMAHKTTATLSR